MRAGRGHAAAAAGGNAGSSARCSHLRDVPRGREQVCLRAAKGGERRDAAAAARKRSRHALAEAEEAQDIEEEQDSEEMAARAARKRWSWRKPGRRQNQERAAATRRR